MINAISDATEAFLAYLWLSIAIIFDIVGLYSFIKVWQNSDDFVVKSRYASVLCLQLAAMMFITTLALIDPYISKYQKSFQEDVVCYKNYLPILFFPFIAVPYICRIFRIIRVYRYTENKERMSSMRKLSRATSSVLTKETTLFGLFTCKRRRIINLTNERNVLTIIFIVLIFFVLGHTIGDLFANDQDLCTFINNIHGYSLPIEYLICIVIYMYFLVDLYTIQDLYGVAIELKIMGWIIILTCIFMETIILYAVFTGYSATAEGYYTFLFVPSTIFFSMIGPLLVSYIWMHWHFLWVQNSSEATQVQDGWTIERILNTSMVLSAFEEAAKKRLCSENLDFLLMVKGFENIQYSHPSLESCHMIICCIMVCYVMK